MKSSAPLGLISVAPEGTTGAAVVALGVGVRLGRVWGFDPPEQPATRGSTATAASSTVAARSLTARHGTTKRTGAAPHLWETGQTRRKSWTPYTARSEP